jgi:predicted transposase YbfD/YdcC
LVKVKNNQPGLLMEVRRKAHILSSCSKQERNKGRSEKRIVKTYAANKSIKKSWQGAKTVIYVKRIRKVKGRKGKTSHAYYISSVRRSASVFLKGIREHWGIENRLHYVKDVSFSEDSSKIKSGGSAGIFSLIRNLVINIARINKATGIKSFMRKVTGNIGLMIHFLE